MVVCSIIVVDLTISNVLPLIQIVVIPRDGCMVLHHPVHLLKHQVPHGHVMKVVSNPDGLYNQYNISYLRDFLRFKARSYMPLYNYIGAFIITC